MPVKGIVDQRITFGFGGRKSYSNPVDEVREVRVKPGAPQKFPTKYVVLGMGLSLAAIGIVLVRKKKG